MLTRRIVTPVAQFISSPRFSLRDLRRRIALLLLLAAASPAWAATLTVTTNADSGAGSLRAQISAAASGDTIVFAAALDGATISLTTFVNDLTAGSTQFGPSAFFISGGKSLTIDALANGLTQGVVIARSSVAGTANFRLFDVGSGSSLTLRGVTLANGYAEGGHSKYAGGALGAGGAIFNQGALTLDRCTLTGNTALGGRGNSNAGSSGGGGVGQNSSYSGGGPNGGAGGATSLGGVDGGTGGDGGFGGGGGEGGSVFASDPSNAGRAGSGGFGGGGGQGGYATGTGTQGNGGNGGFGAGAGSFVTSPATYGVPGFGGGSANASGGYGGAGAGMGGAIFNDAGTVSLTNVTLTANTANGGGNGYAPAGRGSGYGGAIFNYAGSLTLNFVTVSGNSVAPGSSGSGGSADGGAIYSLGDSPAACSAGGNPCGTLGNAVLVMNRSVAANSIGGTNDVVVSAIHGGTSTGSGAYNAVGAATGFTASNAVVGAVSLGALPATIAGGRVDVMSPQVGSVLINATPCGALTNDQRGITRPQGAACDVGAVEVAPVNQATLVATATPSSIVFNATSALSTTGGSGGGAVSYSVTAGSAFCSVAGSTLTGTGVGTCTVTATKAADATYNAATATVDVTVGRANQATLSAAATPASIVFNATSALSTTGGSGGGAVSYLVTAGNAFCSIAGSTLTGTGVGTCTVTATKAADANYNAATATVDVTVGRADQATLVANATPANIVFNATSALSTTGGSGGGAVSYSVTAGNAFCSIAGSTLTGTGVGTCTVTATKAADTNYNATTATVDVTVGRADQATLFANATPASIVFNATSALSTTGGSGNGAVSYSVTAGSAFCSIAGTTLTGTGVGTCTVTATKAADANYNAATATVNVQVSQAGTTIALSPIADISLGQSTSVTATVAVTAPGSGTPTGTITVTNGGAGVGDSCTITLPATACTLTPSTAGNQTITAAYSGSVNFTASSTSRSLLVNTLPTAISLSSSPNPSTVGQTVLLTATVRSVGSAAATLLTGSVTFSDGATVLGTAPLDSSGVATLSTTFVSQGSHTLTARYSGDASASVATINTAQQVDPAPPIPAVSLWALALLALMLAGLAWRSGTHGARTMRS